MMNHEKLIADEAIRQFYTGLDCPRSLTCWLLFSSGEHDQLAGLEFNPLDYNSKQAADDSLCATKFLSKCTYLTTTVDKRQVALDKFFEAEHQCKITNKRILRSEFSKPQTSSVLYRAKFKIERVLGKLSVETLIDACNWGPGATVSIKRNAATHPNKFQTESGITSEAYNFVAPWWSLVYPNWTPRMTIQNASKLVTVPKNAKTDRTIAIEPGLNLWFQKGIGTLIRRKLLASGIDLNSQEHNAKLSRLGSRFNHLATVDFSSASDTISKEVVKELLPKKWYYLCEAFRSSLCQLDDKNILLEKFSSMGNGFTFELESLIFYALAEAVHAELGIDEVTSVYGDDVILSSRAVDMYTAVCADLGFTVNVKKSYSSTCYRESCGAHWWLGASIKPIFHKEPLNGKTAVLKLANSIRRLAHRRSIIGCDRALRRSWHVLADYLGRDTPRISEGYGDIGLIENIDGPGVAVTRAKHGLEGYFVRVWAVLAAKKYYDSQGLLLYKLKSIGRLGLNTESSGGGNNIPLPGRTKHAKIRVLVPRWYDLGEWV